MRRFFEFLRKERLYLLLLVFILVVNAIVMIPSGLKTAKAAKVVSSETAAKDAAATLDAARRAEVEKVFAGNGHLTLVFGLTSLLIIAILLLGIAIDLMLAAWKFSRRELDISTYTMQMVKWGLWDVAKVIILFIFFGYIFIMIESVLIRVFPLIKDDNFRMILNSSVLDALGVIFILYFTVGEYKEKLITVGLSLKNFFRNVFLGIVGYIAIVPILIGVLAAIALFINMIHYVPDKQPVVELFLKEKNTSFLLYTSIFAAIVGPIIEELFFRGFMYNAFKKRVGIFWAMLITAGMFALLHAHAVGFLPILVLGMLLAYLYEKTGTLVSSITVHMIHNLSMVFLVFLVKQLGV
jgi:membrane protease YdiL (CAAX protease family)